MTTADDAEQLAKDIMQVSTMFRLLGYPGLAMILFVIAAGAGAMPAVQNINRDRSSHRGRS